MAKMVLPILLHLCCLSHILAASLEENVMDLEGASFAPHVSEVLMGLIEPILEDAQMVVSSAQQLKVICKNPRLDTTPFHLHDPWSKQEGCDHHRHGVALRYRGWLRVSYP